MTITRPRYRRIRQVINTAFAWRCQACGLACVKAANAACAPALRMTAQRAASLQARAGQVWGKLCIVDSTPRTIDIGARWS